MPSKRAAPPVAPSDEDDESSQPPRSTTPRQPTHEEVEDDPKVQKARQRLRTMSGEAAAAPLSSGSPSPSNGDLHSELRGGWGGSQAQMDSTSAWAQGFRPEERSQIIAFAEEGPYVGYRRHWVDRQTKDGKQTRSYVCLQTVKKECPLCEVGVRPQAVSAFNIFVLDPNGDIALKSWDVGARLYQVLKGYANDPKIGPLTKGFFLVSKTGQKASTQYNVSPIKRTALTEDYDTPIPSEEQLKGFKLYTPEVLQIPLPKEMREIADEMTDEYDA